MTMYSENTLLHWIDGGLKMFLGTTMLLCILRIYPPYREKKCTYMCIYIYILQWKRSENKIHTVTY